VLKTLKVPTQTISRLSSIPIETTCTLKIVLIYQLPLRSSSVLFYHQRIWRRNCGCFPSHLFASEPEVYKTIT